MATATLIRRFPTGEGYPGDARLFRLSTPLAGHTFVVVFAIDIEGTQHDETTIIGAREDGSAFVMNRLPGSLVGWADHAKALGLAGYEMVEPTDEGGGEPESEPQ